MFLRLGATLIVGLLLLASPAFAEKRVALVVGNSAYENSVQLANPVNDAQAIAGMFKAAGFEVVNARTNLGNLEFKRALRDFSFAANNADIAVVFFAGHGIEVKGTNYLLPVDAKLAADFDVEDEAVSLNRVIEATESAKRLRLIILDACRDNPFVKTMKRSVATRALTSGLAKVEPAGSDTIIAYAAKAGSTADDGAGANSPFTAALLKHLGVPGRDIRIAFGHVRDEVLANTGRRQEPFVYGSLGGASVELVPAPKAAPAPVVAAPVVAAPPAEQDGAMRRDYEFAERVGTREAWDSFLASYSTGFYARLAQAQRNKLTAEAERGKPAAQAATPAARDTAATAKPDASPAAGGTAAADKPVGPVAAVTTAAPPEAGKPSAAQVPRLLLTELRRVGCHTASIGDDWNANARRSLERFNKQSGRQLDVNLASLEALDAVKGEASRVCALQCGVREVERNGSCVAKVCASGLVLDSDGDCVKKGRTASTPPAQKPAPSADSKPAQGASDKASNAVGSCGGGYAACTQRMIAVGWKSWEAAQTCSRRC